MAQSRMTGATMSAPTKSPSHQVSQTSPSVPGATRPSTMRLPSPRVAPTIVLTPPTRRENLKILRGCRMAEQPLAQRFTR